MRKNYPFTYISKILNVPRTQVQQKIKALNPNYKVRTHIDFNDPKTKQLLKNLSLSNLQLRKISYLLYNKKLPKQKVEKIEELPEGLIDVLIEFFDQHLYKTFILEPDEVEYFACLLYVGYSQARLIRNIKQIKIHK